jgi:acetyl esterase/lipase
MPISPHLIPLTCILDMQYARRGPALDPAYGADGIELCLDVLGPSPLPDSPLPTVVRIDGCPAWRPGHRNAGIGPFANTILAQAGFLTVSVSVRHTRQATFPAQLHDAQTAVRWLRANPLNLPIDGTRIGIWGQSAGGHLAALLALVGDNHRGDQPRTDDEPSCRVQAAITVAGPSDFLTPGGEMINHSESPVTELVGGTVTTHHEQMRQASPITHVTAAAPPFLIIHGTKDETIPFNQAERLHEALQEAGANSQLLPIPGGYHNLRPDPRPTDNGPVPHNAGDAVLRFFDRHLRQ